MKVVFLDTVHPILEQRLKAANFNCIDATNLDKAQCLIAVEDADGIVIRSRFTMNEAFLASALKLKFIARSGAGMENIDEDYCASRNILMFNAPEGNRNAVGEHALAMILALFNKITKADGEVRKGIWDREGNRGIELDGKVVGIIGYGNNGSAFARKLKGFDVTVLAYDKYKSGFGTDHVKESSLDRIFEEADIISFHIPQNEETTFMADELFFNRFAKPVYVINLSRGKIIRTSALVHGLKTNSIKGACLDVLEYEKSSFESFFEQELPDDFKYILASEKIVLSPHVGGWTEESYFKLSDVLADKILNHFQL